MDAHETSLYTAVLITGLFIVGLTLYFAVSAIWLQRKHLRLQRSHFLAEAGLLERERTRVARDLHDELAPLLSITRYQLQGMAEEPAPQAADLQRASTNLERVMLRMGEIVVNLNASSLVRKGLQFALTDFFLELEGLSALRISFRYDVHRDVPAESGIHLYRIVQEVVYNAFKHSEASCVDVYIKEGFGKLLLTIRDNAKGFRYHDAVTDETGIGLQSIRSRTGMLGGWFDCQSDDKNGTTYFFEFPFPAKTGL